MGNLHPLSIKTYNYGNFHELLFDDHIYSFDIRLNSFKNGKNQNYRYKNLVETISQVEELFLRLMDMKYHRKRILEKYNSLATLFEKVHCNVCYLDIAQRWVYQQDCNKLYKCCIELEARIAEQDESLQRKYVIFCNFARINHFKELEEIPIENIQAFINYPGLVTSTLLDRKCPRCYETKVLSDSQAGVAAYMAYKIQGLLTFYECQWEEITFEEK